MIHAGDGDLSFFEMRLSTPHCMELPAYLMDLNPGLSLSRLLEAVLTGRSGGSRLRDQPHRHCLHPGLGKRYVS